MVNSKLLRGNLETIVLKLLEDHMEMYGYEITQKVKDLTLNEIQLTEGALYPILHKLEGEGILTTRIANIGNRKRKYYKLTPEGNDRVTQKVDEFEVFVQSMHLILNPKLG
ncbi:MAG: PadR family transcriptional regulator [Bacteroidia bacterium]|nr:PadR family transcriptional regulator [Bacteroidia bacterium]